jgi:dimeric dUTPase (all-alpha-NTP-PPase superfamily)
VDALETIFQLQKELARVTSSSRYPQRKEARISSLAMAIVHEAIELQNLTDWKWWKKSKEFNEALAKEEIIDILHFVIQASIEVGMMPTEILNEYRKKNQINIERQEKGY